MIIHGFLNALEINDLMFFLKILPITHTIDTQNIHFPENIETDIDYENLHIAVDIIQKEGVAYVCEYLTTKNYRIDDAIIGIINTYLKYYISVVLEGF